LWRKGGAKHVGTSHGQGWCGRRASHPNSTPSASPTNEQPSHPLIAPHNLPHFHACIPHPPRQHHTGIRRPSNPPSQLQRVVGPPPLQQAPQQAGQHRLALRQRVQAQRLRRRRREGLAAHRALHHACGGRGAKGRAWGVKQASLEQHREASLAAACTPKQRVAGVTKCLHPGAITAQADPYPGPHTATG
jgi:hypothetical protein